MFRLTQRIGILASTLAFFQSASGWTDPTHLAPVVWTEGNWRYQPVYSDTPNGSRVDGFVAVARPGTTAGDNLVAVWFRFEAGAWHEYSWATSSRESAAQAVNNFYAIPASEYERWGQVGIHTLGAVHDAVIAEPSPDGLLESDPATVLVANSTDPAATVSLLVADGWQGADIALNLGVHGAEAVGMLDRLRAATQTMIDERDSSNVDPATAPVVFVAALIPPCDVYTYEALILSSWSSPSGWGYKYETIFGWCVYQRERCRTERRYVYTRNANCTLTVCISSRSVCEIEEVRCAKVGGVCPPPPACAPTTPFTKNLSDEASAWSPPC